MPRMNAFLWTVSVTLIATRGLSNQTEEDKGKFQLKIPFGGNSGGWLSQLKRLIPSPKTSKSNANSTSLNLNGTNSTIEGKGIEGSSDGKLEVTSVVHVTRTKYEVPSVIPSMVKIGVDSGEIHQHTIIVIHVSSTCSETTSISLVKSSSSSTIERKPTTRVKMSSAAYIQHNDDHLPLSSSMQNDYDLTSLGYFVRFEPCQSQPKWSFLSKLILFYPLYYVYAVIMSIYASLHVTCGATVTIFGTVNTFGTTTIISTSLSNEVSTSTDLTTATLSSIDFSTEVTTFLSSTTTVESTTTELTETTTELVSLSTIESLTTSEFTTLTATSISTDTSTTSETLTSTSTEISITSVNLATTSITSTSSVTQTIPATASKTTTVSTTLIYTSTSTSTSVSSTTLLSTSISQTITLTTSTLVSSATQTSTATSTTTSTSSLTKSATNALTSTQIVTTTPTVTTIVNATSTQFTASTNLVTSPVTAIVLNYVYILCISSGACPGLTTKADGKVECPGGGACLSTLSTATAEATNYVQCISNGVNCLGLTTMNLGKPDEKIACQGYLCLTTVSTSPVRILNTAKAFARTLDISFEISKEEKEERYASHLLDGDEDETNVDFHAISKWREPWIESSFKWSSSSHE